MRALLLAPALAAALAASAQGDAGRFFLYWGYNRAWYSASDLHLSGPGYDFTLHGLRAADRPHPFSIGGYFDPRRMWVPQYNYRLGCHLSDHWSLSTGLDHMKYVMRTGQVLRMEGRVSADRDPAYAMDGGSRTVAVGPDLLQFEHTDGLNLLSLDADRYERLWSSRDGRFRLRAYQGVHAGAMIPRSDVHLFGEGLNNRFNLAGFALGAQLGLHLALFRHLFVRNTLRGGWIDLPRILTTGREEDHASQRFWFVQHNIVLGGEFRIWRDRSKAPAATTP